MKKTFLYTLACSLIAVFMYSCNSMNTYEPTGDLYLDIVTFVSTSDGGSVFSVQKDDNSTPVTLTCSTKLDTTEVGNRILLGYYLPDGVERYTSSTVEFYAAQRIINDTVSVGNLDNVLTENVDIATSLLVGNYLDIYAKCDVKSSPKTFTLVLDETTKDDAVPTVHLIFNSDDMITSSTQTVYASFNVAALRNNSTYSGFKLVWQPRTSGSVGERTFQFNNKFQPSN